ncbi:allophanate hydrolase, partial [Arthrobacter sp. GCM10027362]|uniref:allophanate hydrolase n=1 Tax=Arthrobacter sp. GCM10027362 TaxID=3273379 RepID=UPI00363FD289
APEAAWVPAADPPAGPIVVRIEPGPRLDWFARSCWQHLTGRDWTVSPESNRVGVRLLGRPLERAVEGELPSEGMVTGAVQVPPSGLPTVFLADHPVTGGYPVPAVVVPADLPLLAQARPGRRIRFLG